jgi:DNA-binding NarL/FixJ family response regulator
MNKEYKTPHLMMNIKVSITDDHPLAIEGLQNMLKPFEHIRVISGYASGAALLEGLKTAQPDVLLLDVLLPDRNGAELAKMITQAYPVIRILAVSSLDAPIHVKAMMKNGCKGYLLKNAGQKSLLQAVETVFRGEEYMDPAITEQWVRNIMEYKKEIKGQTAPLTKREKEVLRLIVKELSNQEIADQLYISLRTVENHRFHLQQKLGAKNTVTLVNTAIQMGLV